MHPKHTPRRFQAPNKAPAPLTDAELRLESGTKTGAVCLAMLHATKAEQCTTKALATVAGLPHAAGARLLTQMRAAGLIYPVGRTWVLESDTHAKVFRALDVADATRALEQAFDTYNAAVATGDAGLIREADEVVGRANAALNRAAGVGACKFCPEPLAAIYAEAGAHPHCESVEAQENGAMTDEEAEAFLANLDRLQLPADFSRNDTQDVDMDAAANAHGREVA